MSVILENVIKRYGSNLAVDNINFSIEDGEIFGLLGPNGAGKSTTIKMIMGLLKPDHGSITVDGMDVVKKNIEIRKMLGFVPQELAIYENMSARENVEFFGSLYGLRGKNLRDRADEALEFTGLKDREKEKAKKYSGGMKRRLNIACAIVHEPKIIIMDEPTVGIDPQSRNHILESVKELNRRGTTIIYTSHYMEEVQSMCERVGIVDLGRLIALGTVDELKHQMSEKEKIVVEAGKISFNPVDSIKKLNGVSGVTVNESTIEILTDTAQEVLQDVLFILVKDNVTVKNISLIEPDLESVFLTLTGKKLRD